jgi:hypothetical protein
MSYAGGQDCSIKNGMSPELLAYIKTTEKLLGRIVDASAKSQCGLSSSEGGASAMADKTLSAVVGSMNESIGFSNFYTSGRFYVDLAIKTEIPVGITRDHEQLGKEIENIKSIMERVYGRCADSQVVTTNISDDPVYDTSGKTLGQILKNVLQNQVNMMNFYRQTVLGDSTEWQEFILVGNSKKFVSDFESHYGPQAFNACVGKSDFFKDTKDKFDTITSRGFGIEKGMKEWEGAFALMKGNSSNTEYAETESNVLRDELSRQGMSAKASQAIMNNLASYNAQSPNEGVFGFIASVGDRIVKTIDQIWWAFGGMVSMIKTAKNTDQYVKNTQALVTVKTEITEDIIADYRLARELMWPENLSVDETFAGLLETHILLQDSNKNIGSFIKIAQQTCNAQSTGNGNCSY